MRSKIVVIFIILIAIASSAMVTYILLQKETPSKATQAMPITINGIFDINGVIPSGASITLIQKEYYSTEQPSVFASNLPVVDKSPWSFNTAGNGKSYEIQAQVMVNGVVVATSSPIDITAPADEEVLALNLESAEQPIITAISGTVAVNGYIPDGSTITVQGRKLGVQKFTTVAQGLPGQARQSLDYTKALSGITYEVQGTLLDSNGQIIGTSNILTVTAPASNEVLTINSSAQAPTPALTQIPTPAAQNAVAPTSQPVAPVTISGSINLNGAAPPNSRIVIFQKAMDAANYQVAVDNISPTDGATWQWNSTQNATWHMLIAILKQRQNDGTDKDISTSIASTIAAPAASVVMTINSGFSLSPPGGPITVNCQTYNGGPNQNNWNVIVTFQPVNRGGSYWYQIGSTNGGNDIVNSAGQTNMTNATFKNSTTYYARYAYATAPVAALGSNQYSGFSGTSSLQCSH